MWKNPPGPAWKGQTGDWRDGEQHTEIYTSGHWRTLQQRRDEDEHGNEDSSSTGNWGTIWKAESSHNEETELGDGELLEETAESSVEPQEGEVREQEDDGLETEESEPEESESVESNDEGTELDEQPEEPTEEIVSEETQVDLEEAI